jgi:hypothetical protein
LKKPTPTKNRGPDMYYNPMMVSNGENFQREFVCRGYFYLNGLKIEEEINAILNINFVGIGIFNGRCTIDRTCYNAFKSMSPNSSISFSGHFNRVFFYNSIQLEVSEINFPEISASPSTIVPMNFRMRHVKFIDNKNEQQNRNEHLTARALFCFDNKIFTQQLKQNIPTITIPVNQIRGLTEPYKIEFTFEDQLVKVFFCKKLLVDQLQIATMPIKGEKWLHSVLVDFSFKPSGTEEETREKVNKIITFTIQKISR